MEQALSPPRSYGSMTSDEDLGIMDEEDGSSTRYKPESKNGFAERVC